LLRARKPAGNKKKAGEVPCQCPRLATDLEFPEGPVVMPDGSVVLVEIRGRRLTRIWPDGRKQVVAEISGGPNGAASGPDGKCYICNMAVLAGSLARHHDARPAEPWRIHRRIDPAHRSQLRQVETLFRQMR